MTICNSAAEVRSRHGPRDAHAHAHARVHVPSAVATPLTPGLPRPAPALGTAGVWQARGDQEHPRPRQLRRPLPRVPRGRRVGCRHGQPRRRAQGGRALEVRQARLPRLSRRLPRDAVAQRRGGRAAAARHGRIRDGGARRARHHRRRDALRDHGDGARTRPRRGTSAGCISAYLGASRRISAHLGPSRPISAYVVLGSGKLPAARRRGDLAADSRGLPRLHASLGAVRLRLCAARLRVAPRHATLAAAQARRVGDDPLAGRRHHHGGERRAIPAAAAAAARLATAHPRRPSRAPQVHHEKLARIRALPSFLGEYCAPCIKVGCRIRQTVDATTVHGCFNLAHAAPAPRGGAAGTAPPHASSAAGSRCTPTPPPSRQTTAWRSS